MKLYKLTNIYRKLFPSQRAQNRAGFGRRFFASSTLVSLLSGALPPATLTGCTGQVDQSSVDGGISPKKADAGVPLAANYYDYTSSNKVGPMRDPEIDARLKAAWKHYVKTRIDADGRPKADLDGNDIDMDGDHDESLSYSETVAYVLILATWFEDKDTYNKVRNWAKKNLQRTNIKKTYTWDSKEGIWVPQPMPEEYRDHLYAWRHLRALPGKDNPDGIINYQDLSGVDRSGINAASDDIEIAAADWFASIWNWDGKGKECLEEARKILHDAWEKYVVKVGDKYYFFAGDQFAWRWELNSSYLRPAYFAYIFPLIDPDHPWYLVADSSYDIISKSGSMTIEGYKGKNLVTNWNAMNHLGKLVPSRVFEGVAGRSFGRDAIRTLWAVAQASAWFGDTRANRYLTDPSVGPHDFLEKKLNPEAFAQTGFDHDGSLISKAETNTPHTMGLTTEQIFMYGSFLPYFHYAGNKEMTNRILWRINRAYNPGGYWGDDPNEYFTQTWMLLGLKLVNGLPPKLEKALARLPRPKKIVVEEKPKEPKPPKPNMQSILDSKQLAESLTLGEMEAALLAISNAPSATLEYGPGITKRYPQLEQVHEYFLSYFSDFRQYWNNAITLLSVFVQRLTEEGQRDPMELHMAIHFCQNFRERINAQTQEKIDYAPNSYKKTVLDLTEAELRAQLPDQVDDFYQEGIRLAVSAIKKQMAPRLESRPDHSAISQSLRVIGDLYLRMNDNHKETGEYLKRASLFYNYAARVKDGLEIENDRETGLKFSFFLWDIKDAIKFNYGQGHIPDTDEEKALERGLDNLTYLGAIALTRDAALFVQKKGEKNIKDIRSEIEKSSRAVKDLESVVKTKNDFALSSARTVKADLLLFLAGRIKFYYWPKNGANLDSIETALNEIEQSFGLISSVGPSQETRKERIIKRIFALDKRIIEQAEKLYKLTPSKYRYLFAVCQTKLLLISIMTKKFMDHEPRFLSPFYTHPALLKNPIPEKEFLGIEQNYAKGLLLSSTERKEDMDEAEKLFKKVILYAEELDPPYVTYFIIHSKLKMAQIQFKRKKYKAALKYFEETKDILGRITPKDSREMGWRPASFEAEFYHSWAITLEAMGREAEAREKAEIALEKCYLSDSEYDGRIRRKIIFRNFNLKREDKALQIKYGRTF